MFAPPLAVNEYPHLPHWLSANGEILWGADFREHVKPYPHPAHLLAGHIEGCYDYLRRYGILMSLVQGAFDPLGQMLYREMQHLMGTALLTKGVWDIQRETVAEQFASTFVNHKASPLLRQVEERLQGQLNKSDCHQVIFLFEQFLRSLK